MRQRLFLVVSLASLLAIAQAPSLDASHSLPYHWARQSNPFTVDLFDKVTRKWNAYLAEASTDWSVSTVLDTSVRPNGTRGRRRCRPKNGVVKVCNYRYGSTGWLGIAQLWVSGDHIVRARVKLNDTYHDNAPYRWPAWRRLVMCQEIAHALGLDHVDENFGNANLGTCMDYTNDPNGPPSNEHPNAHDYAELEDLYAHLDGTTTVAWQGVAASDAARPSLPPVLDLIDFAGPDQWGELVTISRDGGQAVYELDFGEGRKVITHVTWIPEIAVEVARWAEQLHRLEGP